MFQMPAPTGRRIDLAPMVDLTFLLLIFFLLASQFSPPVLDIALPEARSGSSGPGEALIILVDARGDYSSAGRAILPADLASFLQNRHKQPLTIRADQAVPFRHFVRLLDHARAAGLKEINIEYRPAP
ncbi:MAG: biopolymer transporter ExbD [Spirochaetales bacterium]|nr:biopolymer transporter ExbD [Spirochaetales bacterium]